MAPADSERATETAETMTRMQRLGLAAGFAVLSVLQPLSASAAIIKTEFAGNSLSQYPFFEYVRTFNVNAPVKIAVDPSRFPSIVGHTCAIYVVNHKTPSDWASNPTLTDVRAGGATTQTFSGTNIQANTFQVTVPNE